MKKENELAEKLVAQNGHTSEEAVEFQLMRIVQSVQNEGEKLRRWMWITGFLWVAFFIISFIAYFGWGAATSGAAQPGGGSSGGVILKIVGIALSVVAAALPILAVVSTLILIIRFLLHLVHVWGSGRTEANLRLKMIEARLRQMDRQSQSDKDI